MEETSAQNKIRTRLNKDGPYVQRPAASWCPPLPKSRNGILFSPEAEARILQVGLTAPAIDAQKDYKPPSIPLTFQVLKGD